MNRLEALQKAYANPGTRVRHRAWKAHWYFVSKDGALVNSSGEHVNLYRNAPDSNGWEVIQEPQYEWLWVVEGANNCRYITTYFYKTSAEAKRKLRPGRVIERCEWSRREISNDS